MSERFSIPVEAPGVEAVSAALDRAAGPRRESAFLLAHGAGFSMDSPWMAAVARGLVQRGFDVLRFQYPYRERALREGRNRPPDRAPVLEAAHRRAFEALREQVGERRILLAGKSLGARIATHIAAKGVPCEGLVLLGYPLHPPRRTEHLRDEHFAALVQPALFLQGSRDALCDLELLRRSLGRYGGSATLEVLEGADHGFHVPARTARTDSEVLEDLLERIARWEARLGRDLPG